ncbi:hypothetical protein BEE12_16145 [Pantoea agglomerans]|uniref:hypothetical protein n=1 Tax=Enterobacter agglomerans TaxID=549 RepID=UPI00083CDD4B|nr:hypothetical protein [Pantoea agglomerans]AOE41248.1 hypothetical protein BEE12_16145 [Pantoea agglomerans]
MSNSQSTKVFTQVHECLASGKWVDADSLIRTVCNRVHTKRANVVSNLKKMARAKEIRVKGQPTDILNCKFHAGEVIGGFGVSMNIRRFDDLLNKVRKNG